MIPPTLARDRIKCWMAIAAGVLMAALILPVQIRIDRRTNVASVDPDVLYFSTPGAVKRMALGYESLIADIYWMRAIQYYGRREEAARRLIRYKNLAALLDITTSMDPDLIDAYRAGSVILSEPGPLGAGQPREALRLLERGITLHPKEWQLYFDKGFVYYWHIKDFEEAGRVWLAASRLEGAPYWMEGLAAMGMSKGGNLETARALWQRQYESATRADVRDNARNHLASIQVDEQIWTLEFFVERFRRKTGRFPTKLEELVLAGHLRHLPRDPSDTPYEYDSTKGKIRLSQASKVRYLQMPYDYEKNFRERLSRTFGPE